MYTEIARLPDLKAVLDYAWMQLGCAANSIRVSAMRVREDLNTAQLFYAASPAVNLMGFIAFKSQHLSILGSSTFYLGHHFPLKNC